MKTNIIIVAMLLLLVPALVVAQSAEEVQKHLTKTWKLDYYENADGSKEAPEGLEKDNRITFYDDHKVVSIDKGEKLTGEWEYLEEGQMLSILRLDSKVRFYLTVVDLDEDLFVASYIKPEGTPLLMYMSPAEKGSRQ